MFLGGIKFNKKKIHLFKRYLSEDNSERCSNVKYLMLGVCSNP